MPSSSSPSPDEHQALLQRFVIASRRGEIVALINSARSEHDLGMVVAAELCEAFEAEIAFVLVDRANASAAELIGRVGLASDDALALLREPLCAQALTETTALTERGEDLLGQGIRSVALAPATAGAARVLVGVGRLYEQGFDEDELGLLEAVTKSTAHALERFGLEHQLERAQDPIGQLDLSPREVPAVPDLLPDLDDLAEFFRGLGHPVRLRILLALGGDTLSPSELEERLGVGLGLVAYHVRSLRDDDLVTLVDTRATRGSLESFYRLTDRGELARNVLGATSRALESPPRPSSGLRGGTP
jgi:DNA-binding transcriptional ArsR family regulator